MVRQRPPRQRREVPDVHRRIRGGAPGGRRLVGARADDQVVFVGNTTEAINLMAATMLAGTRVLSGPVKHDANMLPSRRHDVRLLPCTSSAEELLEELLDACKRALRKERFDLLAAPARTR